MRPRLILVTPGTTPPGFADLFAAAFDGGDVASVILATPTESGDAWQRVLPDLVQAAQARGAAALVVGDTRVAGRVRADGVHVEEDLAALREALQLRPKMIVGVGGLSGRDDAMTAGELGADYLLFGRLDRPSRPAPHPADLDLAEWWAELFETPCVVLGGADLAHLDEAVETGAEFVALREAVWDHPEGPAAAVRIANAALAGAVAAGAAR